jgi:hypothetical protein
MSSPASEPQHKRRNDRLGFDRWEWPDGFGVTRYNDGRIKVGGFGQQVVQIAFDSRGTGSSKSGWRAEFAPKQEQA